MRRTRSQEGRLLKSAIYEAFRLSFLVTWCYMLCTKVAFIEIRWHLWAGFLRRLLILFFISLWTTMLTKKCISFFSFALSFPDIVQSNMTPYEFQLLNSKTCKVLESSCQSHVFLNPNTGCSICKTKMELKFRWLFWLLGCPKMRSKTNISSAMYVLFSIFKWNTLYCFFPQYVARRDLPLLRITSCY